MKKKGKWIQRYEKSADPRVLGDIYNSVMYGKERVVHKVDGWLGSCKEERSFFPRN